MVGMDADSLRRGLRGRIKNAGYCSGQLNAGKSGELGEEFLLEVIAELQEEIDRLEQQPTENVDLAREVARGLDDFARGVRRDSLGRMLSYEVVDSRTAYACQHAARQLERPGAARTDALLDAVRALLDEALRCEDAFWEEHEARAHRIVNLQNELDDVRGTLEDRLHALSEAFGEPLAVDDPDAWHRLLEHIARPAPCAVPGCNDEALRARRPRGSTGRFPPSLCRHHTQIWSDTFRARVARITPPITDTTRSDCVLIPELAHLAPSPDELEPCVHPTRYERDCDVP